MSLNQTFAMDQKKVRRYGKVFGTIDFEMNTSLTVETIQKLYKDTTVGTFHIGGNSYDVTLAELDRIIETAEIAKSTFNKSLAMGSYGRR